MTEPNKNTHWKVKNLNGTTGLSCGCGSWLAHWRNYAGSSRKICAVKGCGRFATVGAHVKCTDNRTDNRWWIAPFCKTHNHYSFTQEVFLKRDVKLVAANRKYSCE